MVETKSLLRELQSLSVAIDVQLRKLSTYNDSILVESRRKGSSKKYYYLKKKGRSAKRYLGEKSQEVIDNVKSVKYFEQLRKVIDHDIGLLERINNEYVIPDHDNISALLPNVYRTDGPPKAVLASPRAKEWKERMEARKARYPAYRPEDLVHTALDGTKMRSLSEVSIANYLLSLGITFVYELPLTIKGRRILPDFTILSPIDNKTVIIIEHQGAMDSEQYQAKFIRTVLTYLESDLVPNKDVFFTFNHLDRHLDLRQVDYILHTAFGCDLPGKADPSAV